MEKSLTAVEVAENGLYMNFRETPGHQLELTHFASVPFDRKSYERIHRKGHGFLEGALGRPVEISVMGVNSPAEREGNKFLATNMGCALRFVSHRDKRGRRGRELSFRLADPATGLEAVLHYDFFDGIPVVRCWTDVTNRGKGDIGLEMVSSFAYAGLDREGLKPFSEKSVVGIARQSWEREAMWEEFSLEQMGIVPSDLTGYHHSANSVSVTNTGNWSTKEYLPMGYYRNTEAGTMLFWQIEHNGSWHWELSDVRGTLALVLTGPSELYADWYKTLKPGDSFSSVPVCVGAVAGGFTEMVDALTEYRRAIRRPNRDDVNLPVIFNDYMNCLSGDPTTDREIPLIDAAAKAGCEYFVIDCGWYSAGYWWDGVGEWKACESRFPGGGLGALMKRIRDKGMIPGLWLELEVMGIHCPLVKKVPKEWFFMRHGRPVQVRSRYQLDFRNPEVRAFATETVDRLIRDYHIGYIKMDYNIEPGIGTDLHAETPGDGLLEHQRAYLAWLDSIFKKYPDLVIENCSSGGMRMDYAMLSRYSIQSTSDQQDYRNYSTIAANITSAVTPEQAAVWSYPLFDGDEEETAYNMVNALLLRIHQSGHLAKLSPERLALVQEGIAVYKSIRRDIRTALPFWPFGPVHYRDEWQAYGLRKGKRLYLAVWRKDSKKDCLDIPLAEKGTDARVKCIYPSKLPVECGWNRQSGSLTVRLPSGYSGRLFRIDLA